MPQFNSIHYEEKGTGRPLVLIHGWAMSGRVWAFQRELASDFRLITVDLRGHGRSAVPPGPFRLSDLADDLAALFEHLDLNGATLLGWSLGAQVALRAFHPLRERLSALILVGGTPKFTADGENDAGLPSREVRGLELRLKRDYTKTMGEFFRQMFAPGELSREQENRIAREIVMGSRLPEPEVARDGLGILVSEDLRGLLSGVDRPTLLIHGEEDTICPPAAARLMAERLPDARLLMLPGTGHAPFLSRPEEFNALVAGFMREIHDGD